MFNNHDEDRDFEFNAPYDYKREAYGDPCRCGTLTWGGDCPNCVPDDDAPAPVKDAWIDAEPDEEREPPNTMW